MKDLNYREWERDNAVLPKLCLECDEGKYIPKLETFGELGTSGDIEIKAEILVCEACGDEFISEDVEAQIAKADGGGGRMNTNLHIQNP